MCSPPGRGGVVKSSEAFLWIYTAIAAFCLIAQIFSDSPRYPFYACFFLLMSMGWRIVIAIEENQAKPHTLQDSQ